MTKEEVKKILGDLDVRNYTINDDLTVDVNGYVDLCRKNLTLIPIKFGKVNSYFNCTHNQLTSLDLQKSRKHNVFYRNNTRKNL